MNKDGNKTGEGEENKDNFNSDNDENEGNARITMTIDDIIASTVRALTLKEKKDMPMAELMNLIPKYAGNQNDDIRLWFRRIETVQETYNVDEKKLTLALIGKLDGTALDWFHSKPEFAAMSWLELREEMFEIYKKKDNL